MKLSLNDFQDIMNSVKEIMHENKDYLIELDSAMGDGDLGLTMTKGFDAAAQSLAEFNEKDVGKALFQAGMAMNNAASSTMGTLISSALLRAAKVAKGEEEVDVNLYVKMADAAVNGITERGKAKVGDKTILDALVPAVETLKESINEKGLDIVKACEKAYLAAKQGFEDTKDMVAQHGRAHYYGEKSRGKLDPGAAVAMLATKAIWQHFNNR